MKTGILTTKTIASDDIKDTKSIMGMSSKGMEIAQYFLRDRIYSDKILAVVREYISNACDEHKKHKIDNPVSVTLKNVNNQTIWSVRDYAMGLNEYDIRNVFGMYFESTKSNDNDSIGGFGIGGKAGFSYTDTFYVTSYHKGVKTSYVCTLGSGTKGVPVGEIYKISEEPTTEQGIEISIEAKTYNDYSEFKSKTIKFVEFFDNSCEIVFDYGENATTPIPPTLTKKVGEYTFNQYENAPHYKGNQQFFIRMGGVVYPFSRSTKTTYDCVQNVIVDVPIGKFTLPISRESIENTPLNDKVFEEIEIHLITMVKEERESLTVPKFGLLATGNKSRDNQYSGSWFKHSFRDCFPTTSKYLICVGRNKTIPGGTYDPVSNPNFNKHIIYLFPDVKSTKNWHKRLINALSQVQGADYNGYAYMSNSNYQMLLTALDNTIDVSDCSFVDIKTLKLPKLQKVNTDNNSYQVYTDYGHKKYYTAEELDKFVTQKFFNDEELDDDWYLNVEDIQQLNRRTIAKVSEYGTRSNFWTANSNRMIDALKELGWLTPDSQEYQDIKNKFDEKNRLQRIVDNAKYNLKSVYFGVEPPKRVVEFIEKKPDRIKRFDKVKGNILNEKTTRARILKTFREYSAHITRDDLRRILMMKD